VGRVPLLLWYYGALRLPAVPLLGLRCLRPRIPPVHLFVRSWAGSGALSAQARVVLRLPQPASRRRKRQGLPGSWGTLFSTCPALRPRWDLGVLPSCAKMLPSAFITASAPTNTFYGAQSHGLQNPCIRFVVGLPLPTQYSVPAAGTLGRAGFNTRWVPSKVSENVDVYISSPFPRLGLAQYEICKDDQAGMLSFQSEFHSLL